MAWNVVGDKFHLFINFLSSNKTGSPSVISLLDDGVSVKRAAIDIDINDIDYSHLEAKVNELSLPLIVC